VRNVEEMLGNQIVRYASTSINTVTQWTTDFKFNIYYYLRYNVNEKAIHHVGVIVGTTFRNIVYTKAIKHHNNECGYRYIIGVLYSYNNNIICTFKLFHVVFDD